MDFTSEIITSKDNSLIKHLKKLVSSKKERAAHREFILEGSRLVFDAVKNNAPVTKLVITASAKEKYKEYLNEITDIEKVYISDALGSKISDTGNTQGVFALCRFIEKDSLLEKLKVHGKYVVLSQLQDPGNVGMIIRTADAMGLDGIIFSGSCEIYNPKVVRATMGSLFRIPCIIADNEDDIFLNLSRAQIPSFAAVVTADGEDLKNADFSKGGAVFIGNEGNGLSKDTINKCTKKITIKMTGNIESLNAAMATGIIMWELTK